MKDNERAIDVYTAGVPEPEALPPEKHQTEVQHLEQAIKRLRELGTKDACRFADDLELRLLVVKKKIDRIDQMTVERLAEWVVDILNEVMAAKLGTRFIETWPEQLRDEMFQAVQTAWAASRFRTREAAVTLGVDAETVYMWMKTDVWRQWQAQKARRVTKVYTLADLAMERLAHILSLDTNDPDILKIQRSAAHDVITAGLQVPEDAPKSTASVRPRSHQQIDGGVRQKPPRAVVLDD